MKKSEESMSSAEGFRVKIFQWLVNEKGLPIKLGELFSSRLPEHPLKSNHNIFSLKTSKAYSTIRKGKLSGPFYPHLMGGYNVEWRVFNSKYFGVPQNRERVFIIGHLRGTSTQEVLSVAGKGKQNHKFKENKIAYIYNDRRFINNKIYRDKGIAPTVNTDYTPFVEVNDKIKPKIIGNTSKTNYGSHSVYSDKGISPTVSATNYKHPIQIKIGCKRNPKIKYFYNARKHGKFGGTNNILKINSISPNLTTMTGGNRMPKVAIPCLTPNRIKKRQNGRRFKKNQDPMFTINTVDRQGVMIHKKPYVIREITPRECWRLQGFPDKLFDKAKQVVSNTQLFKQAGNAVTVPVIEYIAKRLKILKH